MAIYHFSMKTIGRASGRSAVASAAYISGTQLYSQETGLTYNYRKKKEVVFRHIFLPAEAPEEYKVRETLWNAVQKVEKRSDARFARVIDLALPREFDQDLQIRILGKYVKDQFVAKGMCADVAIHDKGDGNPHAHIMLTTRGFNPDGSWSKKEKSVYKLDASGNKIPVIDPETGQQKVRVRKGKGEEKLWKRESIPSNDWNKKEKVELWRKAWADLCNLYLIPTQQIDYRSYKRQGLDLEPTIHEGYAARQMESKGMPSDRCDHNRGVQERNRLRKEIRRMAEELYQSILEKARELYGRIKRYLGSAEKGRGTDEASGRGRKAALAGGRRKQEIALTERGIDRTKQDIAETKRFLEGVFEGSTEADQVIDRTDRSLKRSEQILQGTEQGIRGRESEIDSIKQRVDRQREENDRRFQAIMERHRALMEGGSYEEYNDKRDRAVSFGGGISGQDRQSGKYDSEIRKQDQCAGENDQGPGKDYTSFRVSGETAGDYPRYERRDYQGPGPDHRESGEKQTERIKGTIEAESRKRKPVRKIPKKEMGPRL